MHFPSNTTQPRLGFPNLGEVSHQHTDLCTCEACWTIVASGPVDQSSPQWARPGRTKITLIPHYYNNSCNVCVGHTDTP